MKNPDPKTHFLMKTHKTHFQKQNTSICRQKKAPQGYPLAIARGAGGAGPGPNVNGRGQGAGPGPRLNSRGQGAGPGPRLNGKGQGAGPGPNVNGRGQGAGPGPNVNKNRSNMIKIGPIWSDFGPIWLDLVPKVVNKSRKTYLSRNVPKLIGNGSYSLWGSWEPVFFNIILSFYNIIRDLFFLLFITPITLLNFLFP